VVKVPLRSDESLFEPLTVSRNHTVFVSPCQDSEGDKKQQKPLKKYASEGMRSLFEGLTLEL
jgi:hypothetical protein